MAEKGGEKMVARAVAVESLYIRRNWKAMVPFLRYS